MVLFFTTFGRAGRPARPPVYDGPALPTPPQQHAAWERPKTKLPEALLNATADLFDQGVADPRGGEYRSVKIRVGDVWNGGGDAMETHAWVLPSADNTKTRFAVCWNGLVYPCVEVGGPAKIDQDIAVIALAKQDRFFRHAVPESKAVLATSPSILKLCLLLRVGRADLAEAMAGTVGPQLSDDPNGQKQPDDPYLALARDWCWYAFDRAVCCHMRGDDIVSRDTAALLTSAHDAIEAAAAKRQYVRPRVMDPKNWNRELPNPPYVTFLGQLPQLLADEERRVKEGPVVQVLDDLKQYPDKPARITALIRDLQFDSVRQRGQPGGVGLDDDPIPRALENEGPDAVEPLIDCMEHDTRLTRAVSFGRDFFKDRYLHTVAEAAYLTICHLLQVSDFGVQPWIDGDWPAAARAIRAYWAQHKNESPAERWYATLRDENAQPKQWLEATMRIVQPVDVESRGGWVNIPTRKPGEIPAMRGEALRDKHDPSVSELIARRIPAVAAENHGWLFALGNATDMALALHRWDTQAAAPVLSEQLDRCLKLFYANSPGTAGQDKESMSRNIPRLVLALAGDPKSDAVGRYTDWIKGLTPEAAGVHAMEALTPLWKLPPSPVLARAGDVLWNGEGSPWRCLPIAPHLSTFGFVDLVETPVIATPAFRTHLLRNLADEREIGGVKVEDSGLTISVEGRGSSTFGAVAADEFLAAAKSVQIPLRVCDWYAWKLSNLSGAPLFQPYWPQEKRDAACKTMADFVTRWSGHFKASTSDSLADENRATLTFRARNTPATAADVAADDAIFSLTGAQVRVVPLDPFPKRAKWTTLKDFPTRQQVYNPATKKTETMTSYLNTGLIWQAEEVFENGAWHRYYGFVGPHVIAKVPAEEIELLPER